MRGWRLDVDITFFFFTPQLCLLAHFETRESYTARNFYRRFVWSSSWCSRNDKSWAQSRHFFLMNRLWNEYNLTCILCRGYTWRRQLLKIRILLEWNWLQIIVSMWWRHELNVIIERINCAYSCCMPRRVACWRGHNGMIY